MSDHQQMHEAELQVYGILGMSLDENIQLYNLLCAYNQFKPQKNESIKKKVWFTAQ